MATERTTEQMVYDELMKLGYSKEQIEMQKSDDPNIQRLLSSKNSGKSGRGMPEYIIKLRGIASDLMVVECKREISKHQSQYVTGKDLIDSTLIDSLDKDTKKTYAEDGVLHYMNDLSKEYNVVGLAISGTEKQNKVSTFTQNRQDKQIKRQPNQTILKANDYINILKQDGAKPINQHIEDEIESALPELHNFLRDEMELGEQEKPLVISAILLALTNASFAVQWRTCPTSDELADNLITAITHALKQAKVSPEDKVIKMVDTFSCVKEENIKRHLKSLISRIDFLFSGIDFSQTTFDIAGAFYNEFLKYTGGDKQGLGIVLTPKHITEIACDLGLIDKDSVVLDTCTGTAGFLISAMNKMIELAGNDGDKIDRIKRQQIVGVEFKKEMFTLACSNMILRNDGKANMFNMSCFELNDKNLETLISVRQKYPTYDDSQIEEILEKQYSLTSDNIIGAKALAKIKQLKPNVCLINPPYSKKNDDYSELAFIKKGLDLLEKNGKLVAIVPVSCAVENVEKTKNAKESILKDHKLEAVLSMPSQLFPNVGTVTCIMVFTAKQPHKPDDKVFFGYYKDDGFRLTKNTRKPIIKTIIDSSGIETQVNTWENEKKPLWIKHYKNKTDNVPGLCCSVDNINHNSEWCAEAYMETDFSKVSDKNFIANVKKFNSYLYENDYIQDIDSNCVLDEPVELVSKKAKFTFKYNDVFEINKPAKENTYNKGGLDDGDIHFVTATESNNGVSMLASIPKATEKNVITVASNGSVGESFYQIKPFGSTADINIVKLRNHDLNPFLAMYLITLIKEEKFKYNYGRKWGKDRMEISNIELPIKDEFTPAQIHKMLNPVDVNDLDDVVKYSKNVKSATDKYDTRCNEIIDYVESIKDNKKLSKKLLSPLQDMVRAIKTDVVNSAIDYEYMENYIKQLPHTSSLLVVDRLVNGVKPKTSTLII